MSVAITIRGVPVEVRDELAARAARAGKSLQRRHELAGLISADQAAQAHADLLDLAIELWPYGLLAPRAWELRDNLSTYDASYVALAEVLGTGLVTPDRPIARAPGVRCAVATPD